MTEKQRQIKHACHYGKPAGTIFNFIFFCLDGLRRFAGHPGDRNGEHAKSQDN